MDQTTKYILIALAVIVAYMLLKQKKAPLQQQVKSTSVAPQIATQNPIVSIRPRLIADDDTKSYRTDPALER